MMKPGSKYQLFIPADLAYGERAVGKDIGPNSTLIFEVELVGIKPPDATPTPPPPGAANKPIHPSSGRASGSEGSRDRAGSGVSHTEEVTELRSDLAGLVPGRPNARRGASLHRSSRL